MNIIFYTKYVKEKNKKFGNAKCYSTNAFIVAFQLEPKSIGHSGMAEEGHSQNYLWEDTDIHAS